MKLVFSPRGDKQFTIAQQTTESQTDAHTKQQTTKRASSEIRASGRRSRPVRELGSEPGGRAAGRDLGESRYTMKSKLPWFSSVQPRALTHISIHRLYDGSVAVVKRLANPRTSLHPCAATPRMHTYTRTHAHLITRSIHSLTLREYT